jgi:hypothetical protein
MKFSFDKKRITAFRALLKSFIKRLNVSLKVCLVSLGSIFAVVFASLVISIMQFQSRLSEARTQNSNVTFESVQLIAEYQTHVSDLYIKMRDESESLTSLRAKYLSYVNSTFEQVSFLCNAINPPRAVECLSRLTALINSDSDQIESAWAEFKPDTFDPKQEIIVKDSASNLKKLITSGVLHQTQINYYSTQQQVQSECQSLTQFVSIQPSSSSLLAVSPELRMTIVVQCNSSGSLGSPGVSSSATPAALFPLSQERSSGESQPAMNGQQRDGSLRDNTFQPEQTQTQTQGVNRLLLSELVFYYKFYDWLTSLFGYPVHQLILAPPEFIVIILVIATGILGSFLFHTYSMFLASSTKEYPSLAAIILRATLGVMCALVIFILTRTGFVAITESTQRSGETVISPFVIAFISVAAGLLANRALEFIKGVGLKTLDGGSGGDPKEHGGNEIVGAKN